MDDRFLEKFRREPRPEFARDLRERLRADDSRRAAIVESGLPRPTFRYALAGALLACAVAALFVFPSVRASAQSLLDLFRVRNFAAVPFDPERLERLHDLKGDDALMVFGQQEVLSEPGPPMVMASPRDAAPTMGFIPLVPTLLPQGLKLTKVELRDDAEARLTVSAAKLRALLEMLDVRDMTVPQSVDGAKINVHIQPVLRQSYEKGDIHADFVQALSPEVGLPPGADLAQLGEIGLRILGLDASEARRFARSIDWRTTLVVPVPPSATGFRQVTVRGQQALYVSAPLDEKRQGKGRSGGVILWADGERVFALVGNLNERSMMEMAESVQ